MEAKVSEYLSGFFTSMQQILPVIGNILDEIWRILQEISQIMEKVINYDDMTVNETSQSRKKVKKVLSKDDLNEVRTSLVSLVLYLPTTLCWGIFQNGGRHRGSCPS